MNPEQLEVQAYEKQMLNGNSTQTCWFKIRDKYVHHPRCHTWFEVCGQLTLQHYSP